MAFSFRGIKLQAGRAYRLNVGGAVAYVESVKPYPIGPVGVYPPEQAEDADVMAIPGSTRARSIGLFACAEEVDLSPFNQRFVDDLPRLRAAGTASVRPPVARKAKKATRARACLARYEFVKPNPTFMPGTQSGLVQSALQSLDKPTKQEIADYLRKQGWKWGVDPIKATRWYVDVLAREGYAKEIN